MTALTKQEALAKLSKESMQSLSLEALLVLLCTFGEPRLTRHSSGWRAAIDMHVAAVGAKFSVGSEFGHVSPLQAAVECASRMVDTLNQYTQ